MDALHLAVFLIATFAGALVTGLTGFAFGLIVSSAWLFIMTPAETASLIIAFGLIVQGYAVWKLRHALDWRKFWPFVVGGALGVPLGVAVLTSVNPGYVRAAIGAFLIIFSLYSLFRPPLHVTSVGPLVDTGVGFLNGALSGLSGLSAILVIIWCQLRGWTRDQQRAVFQPVAIATFLMTGAWLGGSGAIGAQTAWLFVLGLPVLLAGTWLGMKLYGRIDEAAFRKAVLVVLLVSGVALMMV
jgi:uncharacterized membrane protein YfcA